MEVVSLGRRIRDDVLDAVRGAGGKGVEDPEEVCVSPSLPFHVRKIITLGGCVGIKHYSLLMSGFRASLGYSVVCL